MESFLTLSHFSLRSQKQRKFSTQRHTLTSDIHNNKTQILFCMNAYASAITLSLSNTDLHTVDIWLMDYT